MGLCVDVDLPRSGPTPSPILLGKNLNWKKNSAFAGSAVSGATQTIGRLTASGVLNISAACWKPTARLQARAARCADRLLAEQLHERGVPLDAAENAFILAATRRRVRPEDAPPLGTVRSLAYFLPVIEEVLETKVNPEYYRYLRHRFRQFAKS